MNMDNTNRKQQIRKEMKEIGTRIEKQKKIQADTIISEKLLMVKEVQSADSICVYASTPDEVETRNTIVSFLSYGKKIAVPRIGKSRSLELCVIQSLDELVCGRYGIMEPQDNSLKIHPDSIDVFIIPVVACDRNGYRLGRGMGYYDVLLSKSEGYRIALSYACQILTGIPHESHDIRMDMIISEKDTLIFP